MCMKTHIFYQFYAGLVTQSPSSSRSLPAPGEEEGAIEARRADKELMLGGSVFNDPDFLLRELIIAGKIYHDGTLNKNEIPASEPTRFRRADFA